jgi:hypothetical protein
MFKMWSFLMLVRKLLPVSLLLISVVGTSCLRKQDASKNPDPTADLPETKQDQVVVDPDSNGDAKYIYKYFYFERDDSAVCTNIAFEKKQLLGRVFAEGECPEKNDIGAEIAMKCPTVQHLDLGNSVQRIIYKSGRSRVISRPIADDRTKRNCEDFVGETTH